MSEHDEVMRYLALLPGIKSVVDRVDRRSKAEAERLARLEERITVIEHYHLEAQDTIKLETDND